jgi:hypothetical protein
MLLGRLEKRRGHERSNGVPASVSGPGKSAGKTDEGDNRDCEATSALPPKCAATRTRALAPEGARPAFSADPRNSPHSLRLSPFPALSKRAAVPDELQGQRYGAGLAASSPDRGADGALVENPSHEG